MLRQLFGAVELGCLDKLSGVTTILYYHVPLLSRNDQFRQQINTCCRYLLSGTAAS